MPDIGVGLIAVLDEEFRYLQRKKLVKELESVRLKVSSMKPVEGDAQLNHDTSFRTFGIMESWPSSRLHSHIRFYMFSKSAWKTSLAQMLTTWLICSRLVVGSC